MKNTKEAQNQLYWLTKYTRVLDLILHRILYGNLLPNPPSPTFIIFRVEILIIIVRRSEDLLETLIASVSQSLRPSMGGGGYMMLYDKGLTSVREKTDKSLKKLSIFPVFLNQRGRGIKDTG